MPPVDPASTPRHLRWWYVRPWWWVGVFVVSLTCASGVANAGVRWFWWEVVCNSVCDPMGLVAPWGVRVQAEWDAQKREAALKKEKELRDALAYGECAF